MQITLSRTVRLELVIFYRSRKCIFVLFILNCYFFESSHDNNDGPIFRTQQTSQGTEQWSFRDHITLSEDESLASQDSKGSKEDTAASTNFEAERELQGLTSQSPDNQLGYTELHSLEVENCGYESDSQEQVILPGTSGIVNSHPQLKQNYGHENKAQNHSVIRPYSSWNENPRQNDGRGMEQQQQVTRPGLSCNENHRPQLNRNDGHGCEPQQQLVIRPGPSRNVNCQRENTRNVIEPQQPVMPGPSRKVNSHPQHENSRHGSNQQQHVIRPGPS
ncbi:uncharacterized protein LOC123471258 [Daphnia magna]|uniref:uncharacterized protein LOC123471258 n=1 Tax=Daphnia magna TaxID=35525 RepID=UPI001E1BB5AE|nr:uncharacterized protein LOC123471258 [Daphnia magna]